MRMTLKEWRRDTRRLPKWKELVEAKAEYKAKMIAYQDNKGTTKK